MTPRLPDFRLLFLRAFLAAFASLLGSVASSFAAQDTIPFISVAAKEDALHFQWHGVEAQRIEIREIPTHTSADPVRDSTVVWEGNATEGSAEIARLDGPRDRIYAKYQIAQTGTHAAIGEAKYVTDFSLLKNRNPSPGPAAGKKGLTCILDMNDAKALGIQQVNQNIDIGGLIDWQSASPSASFEFEGKRIGLRANVVEALDRDLLAFHSADTRVTGILLNIVGKHTPRNSPLLHPLTDPATVVAGPSAFNTATTEGLLYYRAILHWLVERYTRPDAKYGRLGGLVIGNEVQSHWEWYHMGAVEPAVLLREYGTALRAADLATRSQHEDFPIYLSLDHHWALPATQDPLRGTSGMAVVEGINEQARREGNFPWNVAYHPYPENLGEPRFWHDRTAPLRFDAPRITFHNLEVLPAFLRQPQFLYEGKSRRIALTEQGFHTIPGPDGETLQAAAYGLAWKKVQALPEVEAFLYHRHVDHPHEDGLHCGVRAHDGSPNVLGVGPARKIWEVMQKAGTAEEDQAFAFALPVIGRADWSNVVATSFEPSRATRREPGKLVFDFVEKRGEARQENLQAVEVRSIGAPDEVPQRGLQEHPKAQGAGLLSYQLRLPAHGNEESELLVFDALLNHVKSHGIAFAVRVDGREMFHQKLAGGERASAEIDLASWSGREVSVQFVVDALGDPSYAWATWVAPRIVLRR